MLAAIVAIFSLASLTIKIDEPETVDRIEVNLVVSEKGERRLEQVIFWQNDHVRDWMLLPKNGIEIAGQAVRWAGSSGLTEQVKGRVVLTVTFRDPELDDRKELPCERRRTLKCVSGDGASAWRP